MNSGTFSSWPGNVELCTPDPGQRPLLSAICLPAACEMSKSCDRASGLVALTPTALTRTEKRAPLFCRLSWMPLYSQAMAQGAAPREHATPLPLALPLPLPPPSSPNTVWAWPVAGYPMASRQPSEPSSTAGITSLSADAHTSDWNIRCTERKC